MVPTPFSAKFTTPPMVMTLSLFSVDISFSLSDVDVRVRRAGLDLDPGWVAWLNRVVTIHYLEGNQDE